MTRAEQTTTAVLKIAVAACLGLFLATARADGPAASASVSPPADAPVPFSVGERLQYRVGWQGFLTAATAELRVIARRPFYGKTAWHFQARARTVEPVRYLYALDDQFDSYTDTTTLSALQYETYLREQARREDSVVRLGSDADPPGDRGTTVRVPRGTRDPLGAFYALRTTDWRTTSETRTPVYDGKKLYDLRARRVGTEEAIQVAAGRFRATRLDLRVYERGREVERTRFRIWLAHDAARTPVLIEAELPFGIFRVEWMRPR